MCKHFFSLDRDSLHNTFINSLQRYVFTLHAFTNKAFFWKNYYFPLYFWYFYIFLVYYMLVHVFITHYFGDDRCFPHSNNLESESSLLKKNKTFQSTISETNQLNIRTYIKPFVSSSFIPSICI